MVTEPSLDSIYMASEIRANKQTNRAGLGTVTYTDTGIIVSGIVTATSFKGDGSNLTGVDSTALKDPAGNVKIQAKHQVLYTQESQHLVAVLLLVVLCC